MSTRSLIGVLDENSRTFQARYCHSDGYPTYQVPALAAALHDHHDGDVGRLAEAILRYDWSIIDADQAVAEVADPSRRRPSRPDHVQPFPGVGYRYTDSYFDGFWHTWLTVQSVDITPDVGDPDRLTWSMWVRGPSGYTWITRAPWNTLLGDHLAATVATLPAGTVAAPTGPATISVLTALPPRARRRVLSRFRRAASRLTRRLRRR